MRHVRQFSATVRALVAGPAARAADRLTPGIAWSRERWRPIWAAFTPAGTSVLVLAVLAWALAWRFGWGEFAVLAAAGGLLTAMAALFTIGRSSISVKLEVEPPRVTVGESLTGSIEVTSRAGRPLLPSALELPVGDSGVGFDLPVLRPGSTHEELFVIPTQKRGVIPVGPVTSVKGDPVGVFRREVALTGVDEIFVHPEIVNLEPLSTGLIRDAEGHASDVVSASDLDFHTLREYVRGDDLRHVHWRSSARHSALAGQNTLLVRQFLETRRSHLNVIVDCRPDAFGSEADYETAISVAGSLLVRAILDGYEATFLSGPHVMTRGTGRSALDSCARAEPGDADLVHVASEGSRLAPDTSVAIVVTGPGAEFITMQRAAAQFPVDAGKIGLRVDAEAQASLRTVGDLRLLTLSRLDELPALMRWGQ